MCKRLNSRTIPRNTWKVYSYNMWNWLCTVPAHDHHVHLHTQSHLHMHTTKAPCNAVSEDQGKRRTSRHELKTARITVPGGGLPAQYTQYLHTLTTLGETRTWSSRVVERAPVDWASSRESSYVCSSIRARIFKRVLGATQESSNEIVAPSRVTTYVSTGHTRTIARVQWQLRESRRTCTWIPVSPALVQPSDIEWSREATTEPGINLFV
jgi:hypothetical protein